MNGVADQSLVRQPATTCPWLQRLIPVLQCVARAATTAHSFSYWVAITYVFYFKYYVKKCTILSSFLASRACYTTANHMWLQLLCVARTPPFTLHTNDKCVYTLFLDGLCNGDRLCGLVVRVSGYRYRGPGFDSRRYQIF